MIRRVSGIAGGWLMNPSRFCIFIKKFAKLQLTAKPDGFFTELTARGYFQNATKSKAL
jgi:hypothetical protein